MGFQRQLCEFEKLLHLKKSYSSPNRVDKLTQKSVTGVNSSTSGKQESILKQVNRSFMRGPAEVNTGMFTIPNETVTDGFYT